MNSSCSDPGDYWLTSSQANADSINSPTCCLVQMLANPTQLGPICVSPTVARSSIMHGMYGARFYRQPEGFFFPGDVLQSLISTVSYPSCSLPSQSTKDVRGLKRLCLGSLIHRRRAFCAGRGWESFLLKGFAGRCIRAPYLCPLLQRFYIRGT